MFQVVFIIVWSLFSVWTIRKLSYLGSQEASSSTIRYGVKGYGITMWVVVVVMGVVLCCLINPNRPVWYYAFVIAFTLLPICLWGGYVWGAVMSSLSPKRPIK